jgi:hypothetical protein
MSYTDSRVCVHALPFVQPKKQHDCLAAYVHTLSDAKSENTACIPDANTTHVPRDSFPNNPPPDCRVSHGCVTPSGLANHCQRSGGILFNLQDKVKVKLSLCLDN